MRTDEGGSLAQAEEEANGHDRLWSLDRSRHHCQAAPEAHHHGEEIARLDVVEGEIARDLTQDIAGVIVKSQCSNSTDGYAYPIVKQTRISLY